MPNNEKNPNIPLSEAESFKIELLAKFFRAFGDGTRLKVIKLLSEKDMNVTELVEVLELQQGRVSSHLACLRWCGFIDSYKKGKFVYYTITDKRVLEIVHLSEQMLKDNAEKVSHCTRI